jgi:outer membrane protein assembly factor BamA
MNVEKGWFRQEALSIGFGFEQFIHSWDNLDYYFARQEAQERGGVANIAYKITDNATIHFGVSRKRFTPPQIKAKGESGKAKVKTFDLPSPLPKEVRGLSTFDFFEGVDSGFINALALRLENRGRFLRRGESFFNWRSQAFVETATTLAHGDYDYTIFQFNVYPQLILSPTQSLNFGLHWGHSRGDVPRQKLFSLGGDATLPGYDDDAFVGEHVFLLRAKYDLNWGKWLGDTSRMAPLGVSFLFDAGDARMKSEPLKFDAPKFELGVELNYNSLIRLGFVKSLGKERTASARSHPAKRGYFYFGWHPHLIRP